MKHITSLSIHLGLFPDYNSGASANVEAFRAFLWNDFIPKHGDTLWIAEFSHENIFELLSGLKRSAKEWSTLHGECHIMGIDDDSPCWPIDSSVAHLPSQELDLEVRRQIVRHGGFRGFHGAIKSRPEGGHQISVYNVLPLPPHEEVRDALICCSYWSGSAFNAAEQLHVMAKAGARRLGIPNVSGLDDVEACWAQGFVRDRHV